MLVVDDDEELRDCLREALERRSFQVLLARTGRDALVALRAFRVDLIVLDLAMPEMDGWQVLDARENAPELARVPTIVVTGNRSDAVTHDPRIQAVVWKPFKAADLVPIIVEWTATVRGAA